MTLADELLAHTDRLRQAARPQDIFGPCAGADETARLEALGEAFRKLAMALHPDRYVHSPELVELATEAFQRLTAWRELAETQIRRGATSSGQYLEFGGQRFDLLRTLPGGDVCDVYVVAEAGGEPAVLKIARDAANNDLLDNESQVLAYLWSRPQAEVAVFCRYVPRLLRALRLEDGRRANLLSLGEDYVTLSQVQAAYPKGVDGRTISWMGNRLFEFLAWLHRQGVVHGALLPDHVLIHPLTHGALVCDWCYAVQNWRYPDGPHLSAVPTSQKKRYPQEVFQRAAASPRLDLYLAAGTLAQTAGVDLWTMARPTDVGDPHNLPIPEAMNDLLRGCRLQRPDDRFADAFDVCERWKLAQRRAFGARKFHPFKMPNV